jgi:periplasmic protein CpxP/Spy
MVNKRFNWLVAAVIVLALVNLGTLAFIWINKPGHEDRPLPDAREMLIRDLRLNEVQTAQFDSLRNIHFATMQQYHEEMRRLKDDLFDRLKMPADSSVHQVTARIGEVQTKIDEATFSHFHALRALCDTAQKEKFDQIIHQVLRNMAPGRPAPGREKRE